MTWIFAEDFEGCDNLERGANLDKLTSITLGMNNEVLFDGVGIRGFHFTTPEQAKAAYEKIKGMLKPPLTMQQVYAYEPVSKKIPFPAGQ